MNRPHGRCRLFHCVSYLPLPSNTCTRWFSRSATYTQPSASQVMLCAMLNSPGAGPAPGEEQLAVRRVFVLARIAIAVGHIDVALRRHCGVGAAMKRLPAHEGCWLAGNAQRQQYFSFRRALADGVVAIVGEPDRVVGRHEDAVGTGKHTFSE